MEQLVLAQRFNEISEALGELGHRVLVRRARALLEAGDTAGAVRFLSHARDAVQAATEPLTELAGGLEAWVDAGGEAAALVTEPAWVEGSNGERRVARYVAVATEHGELTGLIATLATEQRALAAGEPLPAAPPSIVTPANLPPLPGRTPATAVPSEDSGAIARIGSIFNRRSKAVVEVPSQLTERLLDLDEPASPAEDLVASVQPAAPAPEPIELIAPIETLEATTTQPEANPAGAVAALPELHAPPEVDLATPAAPKGEATARRRGMILLVLLAALAGLVAYQYFGGGLLPDWMP